MLIKIILLQIRKNEIRKVIITQDLHKKDHFCSYFLLAEFYK